MRKFYFLVFLSFTGLNLFSQSLYEPFNYTVGDNVGGNCTSGSCSNNNWTTHSGPGTGIIPVVAGNLTYTGLQASTGNKINIPGNNTSVPRDINRPTGLAAGTTVAYFSFLLKVNDATQLGASHVDAGYFIHFGNTAGSSNTVLFGRVSIRTAGGNYRLGIQNTSGTGANYTDVPVDMNYGSTNLVVVKYDFNGASNDVVTIWVNPTALGGVEPAGGISNSSSTSTTPATFASIGIRNSSATPNADIDEIRVGTTFAMVTPATAAGSLPVHFSSIRANEKNAGIQLDWSNYTESDVTHYAVERSGNGSNFSTIATIKANKNDGGQADYSFTDVTAEKGNNFYRIKSVESNGKLNISNVVKIKSGASKLNMVVFPNPVRGSSIGVEITNLPAGRYSLKIINLSGQQITSSSFTHSGGTISENVSVSALSSGMYQLHLSGATTLQKSFIVQ